MPFGEFVGALRRHWILLLIGLVLTGGLSAGSYVITKPTYEITATVLLLPPASAVAAAGNPYLQLGGLRQTVDLMGVALSDQSTKTELLAISGDVDYTVAADTQTSSPILVVDVKDSTQVGATRMRDLLVSRIPERLQSMQEGLNVVSANRVTSTVLTADTEAKEVGHNRLRSVVVVLLAGVAVTLAFIALWDARRPRKAKKSLKSKGSRGAKVPRKAIESSTGEDPGAPQEPATSQEPLATTQEPETPEESDTFEEPATAVGLGTTDEPSVAEQPGSDEGSLVTQDLAVADESEPTEEPWNDAESLALVTGGESEDDAV
jgi:capsular polysaccharide biosynthesis protein